MNVLFGAFADIMLLFRFFNDGLYSFNLFIPDEGKNLFGFFSGNGCKGIMILYVYPTHFILSQLSFFRKKANDVNLVDFVFLAFAYV